MFVHSTLVLTLMSECNWTKSAPARAINTLFQQKRRKDDQVFARAVQKSGRVAARYLEFGN